MKIYPDAYSVTVAFPFTDLNGEVVTVNEFSAILYNGDDEVVEDFGVLAIDNGTGVREIIVPAEMNTLGAGEMSAARILRVAMETDAGTIRKSHSYIITGEIRLELMTNSFLSFEAAELIARDMVNIAGWNAADDDKRYVALIEAFNRLTRIPMRFRADDHVELGDRTDQFAAETIILTTQWPIVTAEDFLGFPSHFRKAVRMAQVAEANELLEGDVIGKKHREGILSETVGESSIMLRGGKVDYGVGHGTLNHLRGYIYYNHRVVRA